MVMTRSEAGRLGGQANARNHNHEHFVNMGKSGGKRYFTRQELEIQKKKKEEDGLKGIAKRVQHFLNLQERARILSASLEEDLLN